MWKSTCLRTLAVLLCLVPWALASSAASTAASTEIDPRSGVYGLWESAKGTVFAIGEKEGLLQAEVIAMRKPRLDKKNPQAELRTRPVLGLQVLSHYQFKRGVWRGRIYDPGSGSTFSSYIKPDEQGNLRLRGYVGFSLFGKTEIFQPVDGCSERLVGVLDSAERDYAC